MRRLCFIYLFFLVYCFVTKGQNTVISRVSPSNSTVVNVKWYCQTLINTEGFNVYRREITSNNWEKLNSTPVAFKSYKPDANDIKKDKELKNYLDLAADPKNVKDLALLAVLIKSFKSEAFSRYLGIWFDDVSAEKNKSYEYKVVSLRNAQETDLASSEKLFIGNYTSIAAPKNIKFKPGNKKVAFVWEPEPNSYFGVNIYRKTGDTGHYQKITKDPIILSKTKNKQSVETYGEEFFVDSKLKAHLKYQYVFEAVDFFGDPSVKSDPVVVVLRDQDAPKAPDSLHSKVDGKKVQIKWKKKTKEEDLLGYNIYRTNNNDTDFVKLNVDPLSLKDSVYSEKVSFFRSYMYAVSSVDQDGNESISNPFQVEVFDNEAPSKPKNLIIQSDSGRLTLSWDKNPEEDLKGYLVYRTINKNSEDTYVKLTPSAIHENTYTDLLAKNIKNKFLYKVVAVDESLNRSPYSDFASARMPDVMPPNAPFLKTITANDKRQVLIEWLPNAEPDLAGYNIYRKNTLDSGSIFKKLNTKPLEPKVFRFTDRYVEEGVLYEYYLLALDSSQNLSKASNSLKFKLRIEKEEDKLQISGFKANYNTKRERVELKWDLKNAGHAKGAVVYKQKPGETVFSPITGTLEESNVTDADIRKGENYTYQIRAYDQSGDVYKSDKITLMIK